MEFQKFEVTCILRKISLIYMRKNNGTRCFKKKKKFSEKIGEVAIKYS